MATEKQVKYLKDLQATSTTLGGAGLPFYVRPFLALLSHIEVDAYLTLLHRQIATQRRLGPTYSDERSAVTQRGE